MMKTENLQRFTNKNDKANMRIYRDNRSFPLSPSLSIYVYIQIYRNTNTCCSYSVPQSCLCMKCSLGISDFFEEISSLSHSIVLLYFFTLFMWECFLISPCYCLELCNQLGMPFPFPFAFLFSSFSAIF